jgi:CheY-like chemotaxis protein
MPQPLRLLIVEDSDDEARLVVTALERSGYAVSWQRVDMAEALGSALDGQAWDAVVSDHATPAGSAALQGPAS